jgi:large subunit ribosomal protein L30
MIAENLKITLLRSGIRRPQKQSDILRGLGLTRLHQTVIHKNVPSIRGMVKKIIHLVKVEEVEKI